MPEYCWYPPTYEVCATFNHVDINLTNGPATCTFDLSGIPTNSDFQLMRITYDRYANYDHHCISFEGLNLGRNDYSAGTSCGYTDSMGYLFYGNFDWSNQSGFDTLAGSVNQRIGSTYSGVAGAAFIPHSTAYALPLNYNLHMCSLCFLFARMVGWSYRVPSQRGPRRQHATYVM